MRWIVDGMNVIGTRPDAWWKDRDGAMLRLVDMLERWAAAESEQVTVVDVRHAPKPKPNAADEEIIRLLQADPEPGLVRVVTSDRVLADLARGEGATIVGAESFRRRIEEP
jgi:predicted RNA-binding protein with PIN domain